MTNEMVTDAMDERITDVIIRSWNAIADDIFREEARVSIPVDEVVEIVCDASHLENHGGDKDAVDAFRALPGEERFKIARQAFWPYVEMSR